MKDHYLAEDALFISFQQCGIAQNINLKNDKTPLISKFRRFYFRSGCCIWARLKIFTEAK